MVMTSLVMTSLAVWEYILSHNDPLFARSNCIRGMFPAVCDHSSTKMGVCQDLMVFRRSSRSDVTQRERDILR